MQPNLLYHNDGQGRFNDISNQAGSGLKVTEVSRAAAYGDYDNDGDLDAVISCLKGPALVYRNNATAPRVAVRLAGNGKNTEGTGARIRVHSSLGQGQQAQEMMAGGRYVSGDQAQRTFAA